MMEQITSCVTLHHGDCRDVLRTIPDNSIDSVVTDPPYALVSIVKRFGSPNAAPAKGNDAYKALSAGFMGKTWDTGETAFSAEFWAEVLRVLKPGGHVAAFGGSRTYHRMACAIEDAGFEIRDSLMWVYGVGFPKSHNVSGHETFCQCGAEQATERNMRPMRCDDVSPPEHAGAERGQVLQPGVSQYSSQSVRAEQSEGVAGIAQSFMEGRCNVPPPTRQLCAGEVRSLSAEVEGDGASRRLCNGTSVGYGTQGWSFADTDGMRASSGSQAIAQRGSESRTVAGQPISQDGRAWENCGRCGKPMVPEGLGTALKPAFEPIVLARKPLSESTVAANVLRWRTGALNIDGCRIETTEALKGSSVQNDMRGGKFASWHHPNCGDIPAFRQSALGRWPANVCHDGSDEVVAAFPKVAATKRIEKPSDCANDGTQQYGSIRSNRGARGHTDAGGSAARFFYSAKASKVDRAGSKHPTVKPVSLKEWLAVLITPPGGTILDPFAGSGTTGAAARNKGFNCVLIEREAEYQQDIRNRFATSADLLEAAE